MATCSSAGGFPAAIVDMPADAWAEAIAVRHSSRTYDQAPVAPALLDRLRHLCDHLPAQPVVRVVLVREAPDNVFTGLVGGYGRVLGAQTALVMVVAEDDPGVQECAGYLGEAVILEATSLDLGTCWVAGFFDRTLASSLVDLNPGEQVLAISPVGYAQAQPRAGERMMKRMVRSRKRKPLAEIAPGFDPKTWPGWAAKGVELARKAPSAGNRQPWSFDLEDGDRALAVTISSVKGGYEGNISRRLDCGIAMLHFEVGARLMGAWGSWSILEAPGVARYLVVPDE